MANPQDVAKLEESIAAWNEWRTNEKKTFDETGVSQPVVDLSRADLCGADLRGADLSGINLVGANLNGANLEAVNFNDASLNEASLYGASLIDANLSRAILFNAHLNWTELEGANLSRAKLKEADFTDSIIGYTNFADVDLSQVKGLETIRHLAPSTIGIDTIYQSKGNISENFLRRAGVPKNFITYMHSLVGAAYDYYSCFISYSSKDKDMEFVERLYADLQANSVRCWYAPEDLKTGDKFRQRIDEAIRIYDKLLVVLSENSIQSSWVEEEVEGALEKERQQNKLVLFPVRLDNAVMKTDQAWAASLRRTRHIADFTNWKEHDPYQNAFKRLLRDLHEKDAAKASGAV